MSGDDGLDSHGCRPDLMINDLRFVVTCCACPEQYDVFAGAVQVGYVRLRHSRFRVEGPDCGDEVVLFEEYQPGTDAGMFEDEDRLQYLTRAAAAIAARIPPASGG